MCGIVGLIGNKSAGEKCYSALEKLEYRGYDSAGIACLNKKQIDVYKKQGMVINIREYAKKCNSNVVIAHTRWATHGAPSEQNAHPHLSFDGASAVVHNGIIENYKGIKDSLIKQGVTFVSETDSECIVNLYATKSGKAVEKLSQTIKDLEGSYAVCIIDKKEKCILATRKKSPLYVAYTSQGVMVCSDISCFEGYAKEYYSLEEGQIAYLKPRKIKILDCNLKQTKPKFTPLKATQEENDKDGFDFYMQKEINQIPAIIKRIISSYKYSNLLDDVKLLFEDVNKIVLIGCGTAYHASCYGAKVLQKELKIECQAYIASEYRYSDNLIDNKTIAIFVSQSGETADTLACANLCKKYGAKTLVITNVEHSALARLCDKYLPVFAGKEVAVASTKAYVAQILVLYILSRALIDCEYDFADIEPLPELAKKLLNIPEQVLDVVKQSSKVFFLGRQLDYITALEGALKLKEISYIGAEGYAAGELKHGTLALIEEDVPVVVFATQKELLEKTLNNAHECKARGAKIIFVAPESFGVADNDYKIDLPNELNTELLSIIDIIPFQILAFKTSEALGYNPDKPRNLAKSVTVE